MYELFSVLDELFRVLLSQTRLRIAVKRGNHTLVFRILGDEHRQIGVSDLRYIHKERWNNLIKYQTSNSTCDDFRWREYYWILFYARCALMSDWDTRQSIRFNRFVLLHFRLWKWQTFENARIRLLCWDHSKEKRLVLDCVPGLFLEMKNEKSSQ